MPNMLLYWSYCHTEVHAWEERSSWNKLYHFLDIGSVFIRAHGCDWHDWWWFESLHRPQNFLYILDRSDPSWMIGLLLCGFFWVQRNTPHSNQVAMDTAYHTRFGWVWQFWEAQCQKRSVDAIYWPSIMGNFGLFPVLTQEKLDGLALQPMLGNDLQLKHVAEELPLLHHSLPITGFAVGLRRSWSYYAIFVFFLWYCPGLLIPGWTETWDRDGPEERSPGLSGSQLARVRSLPSGLVRSPAPNCHGIAECLHSLSSDHRLGLAKPNLLADEYNRFLSTQCTL